MAEQSGEKSYEATAHRRQQAREQGQTAYSQDLGSALLLVVGSGALIYWGPDIARFSGEYLARQLSEPQLTWSDPNELIIKGVGILQSMGKLLAPLLVALLVAAVASSVFQTGLMWLPDRLQPDFSRLSLIAGAKRIVSLQGAMRLGFGLFKVVLVTSVGGAVVARRWKEVLYCSMLPTGDLARFIGDISLQTALWVGAALLMLALFDFAFQKWKHEQDLRMTHQEVREEMKDFQGDPQVSARRRQVQRQMALQRVGDKVPKADVVVTNPTELAIAIQYDPETMAAPVVIAKGAGVLAQRIRRLALEHNVPIVERKPLAQLLYKQVDVNHPVPSDAYAAVAEVLAYVYQLKGKKIPGAA